jgi:hypothetical protein
VVVSCVFTGEMFVSDSAVGPHTRAAYRTMRVGLARYTAAHVNKAWNRAFQAWVLAGLKSGTARAFALAVREGLGLCVHGGYDWDARLRTRYAYHPVHAWLPRTSSREVRVCVHGKLLATLTLTRRRADWANEETDDKEKHEMRAEIEAHKAPRMELACLANAYVSSHARRVRIPDECWTAEGAAEAEAFVREQAALLDAWAGWQYAHLTRSWAANTKINHEYYWG